MPKSSGSHVAVRIRELRVVPGVEEFRAKIKARSFVNRKRLVHANIPIVEPRPSEYAEAGIAKIISGRLSKTALLYPEKAIGPQVLVSEFVPAVAKPVRPDLVGGPHGKVGSRYSEWISLLERRDEIHTPSAHKCVEKRIHVRAKLPAAANRQIPNRADHQRLRHIGSRHANVALQTTLHLVQCANAAFLSVRKCFCPGVIRQETKATRELTYKFHNQSVIACLANTVDLLHVRVPGVISVVGITAQQGAGSGTIDRIIIERQMMSLIADVGGIQQVRFPKRVCDIDGPLFDVRRSLVHGKILNRPGNGRHLGLCNLTHGNWRKSVCPEQVRRSWLGICNRIVYGNDLRHDGILLVERHLRGVVNPGPGADNRVAQELWLPG